MHYEFVKCASLFDMDLTSAEGQKLKFEINRSQYFHSYHENLVNLLFSEIMCVVYLTKAMCVCVYYDLYVYTEGISMYTILYLWFKLCLNINKLIKANYFC